MGNHRLADALRPSATFHLTGQICLQHPDSLPNQHRAWLGLIKDKLEPILIPGIARKQTCPRSGQVKVPFVPGSPCDQHQQPFAERELHERQCHGLMVCCHELLTMLSARLSVQLLQQSNHAGMAVCRADVGGQRRPPHTPRHPPRGTSGLVAGHAAR